MSVCVCVHVCLPQGYKLHSCDIEPLQPVEQVCYIQKCNEAILCMGMDIVTKHTMTEASQAL